MSRRAESILTYFLSMFIVVMSVLGIVYPLTNPSAYAEMLRYPHYIPMVQHRTEPITCPIIPAYQIDALEGPATCEDPTILV